jgi:hypothetical protein
MREEGVKKEIDMELIVDQALERLIKKRTTTKKQKEFFKALLEVSPYREKKKELVEQKC